MCCILTGKPAEDGLTCYGACVLMHHMPVSRVPASVATENMMISCIFLLLDPVASRTDESPCEGKNTEIIASMHICQMAYTYSQSFSVERVPKECRC